MIEIFRFAKGLIFHKIFVQSYTRIDPHQFLTENEQCKKIRLVFNS